MTTTPTQEGKRNSQNNNNSNNNLLTRRNSYDITDFKFRLEAVFDNMGAREAFQTFLEESQTVEPLLFYNHVEQYSRLRLGLNRYERACQLIEDFVSPNSPHELNLSQPLRSGVLEKFAEIRSNVEKNGGDATDVDCPADLFDKLQTACFIELKEDNFPRFVKSDNFRKLLNREIKKDPSYMTKIGTLKSTLLNSHNNNLSASFVGVDDKEIEHLGDSEPFITHNDIELASRLVSETVDDKIWENAREKSDHQSYVSKDKIQFGNLKLQAGKQHSGIKMVRYDALIPGNFEKFVNFMTGSDSMKRLNDSLEEHHVIEHVRQIEGYPKLPYAMTYIYEKYKFPLFAARDAVLGETLVPLKYNSTTKKFDQYIRLRKSLTHSKYPPARGVKALKLVRAHMFNVFSIERKSDDLLRFSVCFGMDLNGFIRTELLAKSMTARVEFLHERVTKIIREEQKQENFGQRPINSDGMIESLDYYISQHYTTNSDGDLVPL